MGKGKNTVNVADNVSIFGDSISLNSPTRNSAFFGSNISVDNQLNYAFVYNTKAGSLFKPQYGSAFYVNTASGVAVNKNSAHVQLDIN